MLDRMQPTLLKSFVTSHASGVAVLPAARDSLREKVLSPQKLIRVTDLLLRAYDYVVIDLASTLSEARGSHPRHE